MPTQADIRRKNANFASRAMSGKKTTRPARRVEKRSVGMYVLIGMGTLLVGGTVLELARMLFFGSK